MSSCEDVRDLIPWYVEGSLPAEESRRVAAHLAHCSECVHELADVLRIRTELAEAFEQLPKASESLWKRIRDKTQGRSIARIDVGSFLLGFTMGASVLRRSMPVRGDLHVLGRKFNLFDVRKKGGDR